jgi:hypothetical protein
MKKIILMIAMMLSVSQIFAQTCSCISGATGELKFPNTGTGTSILPNATLTIPYNASNNSQKLLIAVSPHSNNTLNTGIWATQIEIQLNNNTVIAGLSPTTNPYPHMSGSNSSYRTIPFSSLNVGTNKICVYARCGGGSCLTQCYNIIVQGVPAQGSANITFTKECCTTTTYVVMPGNPHTAVTKFTGQVRFKMSGTASNAYINILSGGNNTVEGFVNNGYTGCYTLPVTGTILDANTNTALTTSATINGIPYAAAGYHFKYASKKPYDIECMNAATLYQQNSNVINKTLTTPCPCTLPQVCDNGVCK